MAAKLCAVLPVADPAELVHILVEECDASDLALYTVLNAGRANYFFLRLCNYLGITLHMAVF